MNLYKTIKELSNRLDIVDPSYTSSSNNEIRHDGISYWKGKKIISAKKWNELYEKNSVYTDRYKIILISREPLQYFPDDYNGSISSFNEELREEAQKWNKEYYELLEFRKNPTLGRNKCSGCIFSSDLDDPLFVGIEKVIARIVSNQCNNNNNSISNVNNDFLISYPCNVMNFFQCPFESNNNNQYPYTKEQLFALQRIAVAIEQALSIFLETTKNNELIYEVDFENDRIQEIHTNCNGEPYSWGWNDDLNVKEQLSQVRPISPIRIINEQDIYDILTNRDKLEYLLQEYEKIQLDKEQQEVCCDENTPCVPNDGVSPLKKTIATSKNQQQLQQQEGEQQYDSHRGENSHSKNTIKKEVSENEKLISNLKSRIKDELEEQEKDQKRLLKENKQNIINFIIDNKDWIRVEGLKIYETTYRCYQQKGNCHICNNISNIFCTNCHNHNDKELWLCTSHWLEHAREKHG